MEKREDILIEDIGLKDIPVIQALAGEVYMQTYHGIHSDEQNEYMFVMMYSTSSLTRQMTEEGSRFLVVSTGGACSVSRARDLNPQACFSS